MALYRHQPLDEIADNLRRAMSAGRLYNFRVVESDKPTKAIGQVRGFLTRCQMGQDVSHGLEWTMRNIEAALNTGDELIDWDETLFMWHGTPIPLPEQSDMWDEFK